MHPFLTLLRPSIGVLSVLGIVIGATVVHAFSPITLILAALAAFLITGGGNVINDYCDIETDRKNKPERPLPSGSITKQQALLWYLVVTGIGLLLSAFININFLLIALLNAVAMSVYAMKLKKIALVGNAVVAYLSASTFIAAGLLVLDIPGLFASPIVVLAFISFFGTLSRELLKDIEDKDGDILVQAKTLPLLVGDRKTQTLSFFFLLIACLLLPLPVLFGTFNFFALFGFVPAIAACGYAAARRNNPGKAQKIIKGAMFLVFLGFILGSLLK